MYKHVSHTPAEVLDELSASSGQAWSAIVDGHVEAIFGLCTAWSSNVPATPWLVGAMGLRRRKRMFWKASRAGLALMLQHAPHLHGYIGAEHRTTIEWLRRLGFKIAGPHLMPTGIPCVSFDLTRGVDHDRN